MKTQKLKTPQQVRTAFRRKGVSIGSWADANGFTRSSVCQVLAGKNAASIGVGHRIAVLLGLKHGEILEDNGDE